MHHQSKPNQNVHVVKILDKTDPIVNQNPQIGLIVFADNRVDTVFQIVHSTHPRQIQNGYSRPKPTTYLKFRP